jgi:hypothetical protein
MVKINKFYTKNKTLISLHVLLNFSIFFINIIINPILIKNYGFHYHTLSFSNIALILGMVSSTFVFRYLLEHKINYITYLKKMICIFIIVQMSLSFHIYLNQKIDNIYFEYLYLILRFFEGIVSNGIGFFVSFLLGIKLLNNEYKMTLSSLIYFKTLIVKLIAPILATFLIQFFFDLNLIIYVISILVLFSALALLKLNQKELIREYHRYYIKKHQIKKQRITNDIKIKAIFNFNFIKKVYEKNKEIKRNLLKNIFVVNGFRNFYDFYLILFLTMLLKIGLVKSTLLISIFVFAQALVIKTSYMFDKLQKYYYNLTLSAGNFNIEKKDKKNIENYCEKIAFEKTINVNQNIYKGLTLLVYSIYLFLSIIYTNDIYIKANQLIFGMVDIGTYNNYISMVGFIKDNIFNFMFIFMLLHGLTRTFHSDFSDRNLYYYSKKEKQLESYKATNVLLSESSNVFWYLITAGIFAIYSFFGIFLVYFIISTYLFII